ncbi:alpha/beta fold hydrolase [Streptomyces sp. T-3]|nr:alpha/beta fold hydrolase [Streptomyces sp. T-3]
MPAPASLRPLSRRVRPVVLDAAGLSLSGLLIEPEHLPPRATLVALHGGGMSAGYFDGQAHPCQSLLTLGARLGYTVLALDRPGYGASAAQLPDGAALEEQADAVHAALRSFAQRHPTGDGLFLLAHSYGGKLALTCAAADAGASLLGLDVSGVGHRYALAPSELPDALEHGHWTRNWGALHLYPPGTFRTSAAVVAPTPPRERAEALQWPGRFADVAARVRVPVRLTFAEYEAWWRHDDQALDELSGLLGASPRVVVDRQPSSGHNISLGWVARTYHLRALAFAEECLVHRQTDTAARVGAA